MLRTVTALAFACGIALAISPALAKKDKRLPCGDYDGAPSHNDCRPLPKKQKEKCDKIKKKYDTIAEDANFDADVFLDDPQYLKLTKKYKACVFEK